jgi:hypothetical protein
MCSTALEVAFGVAAADGIDREEIVVLVENWDMIVVLPRVIEELLEEFEGIEKEGVTVEDMLSALNSIDPENLELIEITDDLLEEANATIGHSAAASTLCFALCIIFAAGDKEISNEEGEAFLKVANTLTKVNVTAAQVLASKVLGFKVGFYEV